jgi:UV DNA damage endonuclease
MANIGYACLCIGCPGEGYRTCTQKSISGERLRALSAHNLSVLDRTVDYNIQNGILLFRITSDLIPFGSSPLNTLPWQELFAPELRSIGEKIRKSGMRVSMHPGQYTVLNAEDKHVVKRAILDLRYHSSVLDGLGLGAEHKLVLHVGGVYGDKKAAVRRFAARYSELDAGIRKRLVLENDDTSYTIGDTLNLGTALGIPVVYDTLHNAVNPCDAEKTDADWIGACRDTWRPADGTQKIHYAQQEPGKKPGSHSATIRIGEFMEFYGSLGERKPDIMLEVKEKNLSAVKCIRSISEP